jgi:tetratricopeptide (TPR) repeat protein
MRQRLMTVEAVDPYAYTRVDIWRNALQRIADHPLGAGLGMYRYTSFQYRFPVEGTIARYAKRAESAHNEYLQIGADLGVVGLAVFLAGIWILGAEWHGTLNARLDAGERGLVIGLAGGIMGLLVHAAVDSVFHQPALVLLLVLFAGMIGVVKRVRTSAGASTWAVPFPHRPTRVVLVGALAVLLAFLIIRPAAAWYAFDKGAAEMRDGRADQALDWYQLATQIDPGTVSYHDAVALTEATLYQQSGELRRLLPAIEELKVGLDLNPLDGRLANRLGTLYGLLANRLPSGEQQATMVEHAGTYYEQAIRLDPYSPFNYLELAKIRSRQGRESEADAWLKQAIHYEPNFLPARILRAELAVGRGRKDIAVSEYRESVKIAERYRGQPLDSLERRYLEADHDRLKRSLALAEAP